MLQHFNTQIHRQHDYERGAVKIKNINFWKTWRKLSGSKYCRKYTINVMLGNWLLINGLTMEQIARKRRRRKWLITIFIHFELYTSIFGHAQTLQSSFKTDKNIYYYKVLNFLINMEIPLRIHQFQKVNFKMLFPTNNCPSTKANQFSSAMHQKFRIRRKSW